MDKIKKPNKGYLVRVCKQCGVKRHIWKLGYFYRPHPGKPDDQFSAWICSKGHRWDEEVMNLEKMSNLFKEIIVDKVKGLFERDDTFYKTLNKR